MNKDDIEGRGIHHPLVLNAIYHTPREKFVPEKYKEVAYGDHPLPIGHGQTISQPYIVAYMTEQLLGKKELLGKVLEIGTGSGYQAAILSQVAKEVYSVEVVKDLAIEARKKFKELSYDNIHVKVGDGRAGWPEHALYEGIMVTAAAKEIPPDLTDQLAPEGRMIIPIGDPGDIQQLMLITKDAQGKITSEKLIGVVFVTLV